MSSVCIILGITILIYPSQSLVQLNQGRLPKTIEPFEYLITLEPHLNSENLTFDGESLIYMKVLKDTSKIVLHSKNLAHSKPTLECGKQEILNEFEQEEDFLVITTDNMIKNGTSCSLSLKYKGLDDGDHVGFYKSLYKSKDGKEILMASTQLEPIGARQVFPCWDEPAYKAYFKIKIKHNIKYKVLSNMHETNSATDLKNINFKTTEFAKTPLMSTYLIAFAIGEFNLVNDNNSYFRVWTQSDSVDHTKYAVEVGPEVLKALENYTNIPYEGHGLMKIDSLTVPELPFGGMENWGLVIYKQNRLLHKEGVSTTLQKERVLQITAHELAHQWFGNLVTAEWWNDIWLNEGFADYFGNFITNQIQPKWRMEERFVMTSLQGKAFVVDSAIDSHPMTMDRKTDKEIIDSFDNITYSKSACIIRMISHVFGEKNFQKAIQGYLSKALHNSVTHKDLIQSLLSVDNSNFHLRQIIENWITTPGYPVIDVKRNYSSGEVTLTQTRYLNTINATSNEKYWIPFNYMTKDESDFTNPISWFDPQASSTSFKYINTSNFIILNKQQFGYYRINYDNDNWKLIIEYLKTPNYTKIHALNRAQLIDDVLNLAWVGRVDYNIALSLLKYLKLETDFIPWSAAWRGIENISKLLANTAHESKFKNYVLEISENLLKQVQNQTLEDTDHIGKLLRIQALTEICKFGSTSCQKNAMNKFIQWLNTTGNSGITPDEKKWVMCTGINNSNEKAWQIVWLKYLQAEDKEILDALGCTSNTNILNDYLAQAVSRNQTKHLSRIFKAISQGSSQGVNFVLEYLLKYHKELMKFPDYKEDQFKSDLISLSERLTTENQRDKIKKFINEEGKTLDIQKALDHVENNLKIMKKHSVQFEDYFKIITPLHSSSSNSVSNLSSAFMLSVAALSGSIFIQLIY